jgi:hypothetical protein
MNGDGGFDGSKECLQHGSIVSVKKQWAYLSKVVKEGELDY